MKYLHTMLRVEDLQRSIDFYQDKLKMTLFKKKEYPHGEFTLAFLGYEENGPQIELTFNWDKRKYDLGDAYGHIALGVEDIYTLVESLRKDGVKVTREPGPMKGSDTVLAFIEDPDGYKIELIETKG